MEGQCHHVIQQSLSMRPASTFVVLPNLMVQWGAVRGDLMVKDGIEGVVQHELEEDMQEA